MAGSNSTMIHKLQKAINIKYGEKILINRTQFYSEQKKKAITMYTVKKAVWDEEIQKNKNKELFTTTSQLQIVLFLRDYWYILNNKELPTGNEIWNKLRKTIPLLNQEGQAE